MKSQPLASSGLFVGLIALGVASRLLPHPPNFTALGAIALFGGAVFPRSWQTLVLPLAAMAVSDLGLSLFGGLPWCAPTSYIAFVATAIAGRWMLQRPNALNVLLGTVGTSVMFFLASNFAVWARGDMYAPDWAGLMTCYAAAVPFFRNMLAANLIYAGVLFGLWEAARLAWPRLVRVPAVKR